MLKGLHTVLPAADLERARKFYHDTFDLDPDEIDQEGSLVYRFTPESSFVIYETDNAGTANSTQMGWHTDDLEAEIARLRARGVTFEEYDLPGLKTVDSITNYRDEKGAWLKAAWLKDTEGNFLIIVQSG